MKKLLLVTALTAFTIFGATSAFAQEVSAAAPASVFFLIKKLIFKIFMT